MIMESTLIFLLVLLLLPLILSAILNKHRRKTRNLPPGPSSLPLLGNFHQLDGTPFHEYFWKLSKKYGPLLYMKFGSRPVLVANSARMAEEIMKTQELFFCNRPPLLAFKKVSYGGSDIAFAPYSEYWQGMRKICMLHLLSSARVKSFRPIRKDEVSRMIQRISEQASRSETINLTEILMYLTNTTICRAVFGKRYEVGTGESNEFKHLVTEFHTVLSAFYFTDYFPWLGWVDKILGKIDHLEKICKKWDLFYQQLIDEHLQPDRPKSMEGDVLDIMLQLREEKSKSLDLSPDHIKAVLMNVYFASTDPLAMTTIWAMTALIKNPSALKKVQAELTASLGKKQMVEEDDITTAKLPYFNAVIKETLRLYSTIPLIPRETTEKCTIDGFEIPTKTLVYLNAWATGKDPELWENPNEFLPERFLGDDKKLPMDVTGQDCGFIPFGAGRRTCPGMTMALATVEVVVANLFYLFDWELPDGMRKEDVDDDVLPGLSLHKKNPLYLVAKKFT